VTAKYDSAQAWSSGLGDMEMLSRRRLVRSGGGANNGLKPPAENTKPSEPPRSAMSPATSKVAIRDRASDASTETSPVVRSITPAKSACRSMIGAEGSGNAILSSPMRTIETGLGNVKTTPAVIVTSETGRPQPSWRIGPATYWPPFGGKTVATADSTRSARATRSSGSKTSFAWPSRMRPRSDVASTVRLSPKTPPTALSVRPRKISMAGENWTDITTMNDSSPLISWMTPNAWTESCSEPRTSDSSSAPAICPSPTRRNPPPFTTLASIATPIPVGAAKLGGSR
jgi:hypothetical protein